jgi:hypothetical protein
MIILTLSFFPRFALTSFNSILQYKMVQKRRYDDDEVLEVSSKLPRQLGHSNQLVSFSESVFPEDSPQFPHKLGETFSLH